jgi:septum formation protein
MAEPQRPGLVLASASPFRRRMLEAAGLAVEVAPADIDEPRVREALGEREAPEVALALARAKAEAVSRRLPQAWVIGADQVLAIAGRLFAKPQSPAEARRQLQELRGKAHRLHSAAALAQAGEVAWSCVDTAWLHMRLFSDAFLDAYLAAAGDRVCRTVGAYEIEGSGIQLFERVEGDHFTIIGLPLLPLLAELRVRGAIPA